MVKDVITILLTIINLALYLVIIALWLIVPEYKFFNLSLTLFNFILTGLFVFLNFQKVKVWIKSQYFRKLTNESLSIFLLFCILGVINYLAFRNFWQFDVSENKLNTLTEQSVSLVKNFKGPLNVKIFAGKGDQDAYLKLLDLYKMHKRDINLEIIDPEVRPDIVQKYGVTKYGTVLLSAKEKTVRAETSSELDITKALYKLTRDKIPHIFYVVGHQEENLTSKEEDGLLYFYTLLQNNGYETSEINLLSVDYIGEDVDLLIMWGSRRDYTKEEVLKVREYLLRGKRILFAYNPDFSSFKLENLKKFFNEFGVILNNDLVMDTNSFVAGSNAMIPLVNIYNKEHPITKNFVEQTFFPLTTSISHDVKKKEHYLIEELVLSSAERGSYSKTNLKDIINQKNDFVEGQDVIGPRPLMMSVYEKNVNDERSPFKIVVVGCSTLLLNKYKNYGAQFNLILNAINWLSDEEFSITVDRMNVNKNPVYLNSYQVGFIFYFSIIVGPLILLFFAFYFYLRRKKL